MDTTPERKTTVNDSESDALLKMTVKTNEMTAAKESLVKMLQMDNTTLYNNYMESMRCNAELRAIVEKQQKLINAIYNAELKLMLPEEKREEENTIDLVEVKREVEQITPEPVINVEPEIEQPKLLDDLELLKKIRGIRKQKLQSKSTLVDKLKFLKAIYIAGKITPKELFTSNGLRKVTAYRYVKFFKDYGFIKFRGTNKVGMYCITKLGEKFVTGQTIIEEDLMLAKIKNINIGQYNQ